MTEALRTFGLLSGFWRDRGSFDTVPGTSLYVLPTELLDPDSVPLLNYTVTDRDIIKSLQYHLLESITSQSVWPGTEMFTINHIRFVLQQRRNQFLSDTGIVASQLTVNFAADSIGRVTLPDTVIDVRRVSWYDQDIVYHQVWREDEYALTTSDPSWKTLGIPSAYSIMTPPPLTLQLAPPPLLDGDLDMIVINTGTDLDPANSSTVLGIPDDLSMAVKWGALADLLSMDGPARDPVRAAYCEMRYRQFVQLTRLMPVVLYAEIAGHPTIPVTLQEMDSSTPQWQNAEESLPTDIILVAPNIVMLSPTPDDAYTITMDVVRKTPLPDEGSAGNPNIQIGREQLDTIIDYAEHLALFKVGGAEWYATKQQAENFLLQALTYNQRIAAAARYVIAPKELSNREKQHRPRRLKDSDGIGTLSSQS